MLWSLHLHNNHDISIFNDLRINLILESEKKIFKEDTHHIRLSLTSNILTRIISRILNNKNDLNLKAMLCVTFIEFLRSDEFTWEIWDLSFSRSHLACKYIKFNINDFITLTLLISKIDLYHRDTNIQFSQVIFILCSVKAFFILLQV